RRRELDVADVVSPEPGVHQAGDELVVGSVPVILHALDEGRRAIPNTNDRDSDGSHGSPPQIVVGRAGRRRGRKSSTALEIFRKVMSASSACRALRAAHGWYVLFRF